MTSTNLKIGERFSKNLKILREYLWLIQTYWVDLKTNLFFERICRENPRKEHFSSLQVK